MLKLKASSLALLVSVLSGLGGIDGCPMPAVTGCLAYSSEGFNIGTYVEQLDDKALVFGATAQINEAKLTFTVPGPLIVFAEDTLGPLLPSLPSAPD